MNGTRRRRLLQVLALIVVAVGGYGVYWWIELRGTVSTDDAYVDARIITVSTTLPGRIKDVEVHEGDTVQKGDPLARLYPIKLKEAVARDRGEVNRIQGKLDRLLEPRAEEVAVAESEVEVRRVEAAKAMADYRRARRLAEAGAISDAELDRQEKTAQLARARWQVAKNELELMRAAGSAAHVAQVRGELQAAKARLARSEADLVDAGIYAPADGVVAKRTVDPGEVVEPGQGLFQVVESARTWVVANLEEHDIAGLQEGQPAEIYLDAYPGRTFHGRVGPLYGATLSRFSLLSTRSASGNYIKVTQRVPVRIDWTEAYDIKAVPGLNAEITIHLTDGREAP